MGTNVFREKTENNRDGVEDSSSSWPAELVFDMPSTHKDSAAHDLPERPVYIEESKYNSLLVIAVFTFLIVLAFAFYSINSCVNQQEQDARNQRRREQEIVEAQKQAQQQEIELQRTAARQEVLAKQAVPFEQSQIGDIVKLGDLYWRVLVISVDGYKLVITVDIVEKRVYGSGKDDVTWQTSSIRTYLNSEFMDQHLLTNESYRIGEVSFYIPSNPRYGTPGGASTRDYIFLLTLDDFEDDLLFVDQNARIADNFNDAGESLSGEAGSAWWLASPGQSTTTAAFVDEFGEVNYEGNAVDRQLGVRPVMWVMSE
jgi:Na+-transporting methylmalonyl-CoA/oxaloacetate decarboxylase gamma subunit